MASSPILNKWKRNGVFKAIQDVGLNPADIDLEDDGTKVRIKYKWSESYFAFGGDARRYVRSYIVEGGPDWTVDAYSWETVISRLNIWLHDLKLDIDMPDLWADLRQSADLLAGRSYQASENTPFTRDEQKEIARRLKEGAERAGQTLSLSDPAIHSLNEKVDYLIEAAGRTGRIDWKNACVGALISYALSVALPPESARLVIQMLLKALGHLYDMARLASG